MKLFDYVVKNGLCSTQEYEAILSEFPRKPKRFNMLVFGLGYDAMLWLAYNPQGETHFLENSGKWIKRCSPIPNVHKVSYGTSGWDQSCIYPADKLRMLLPEIVEQIEWDVIFVDAPRGKIHGRMKSIYQAHRLAGKHSSPTTIFVHDYNRRTEKLYVDHYFGEENIEVVKRLAIIRP